MITYYALRLDGTRTEHVSFRAAKAASRRSRGPRTVIEIRRSDDRPPHPNDAQGWDAYRLRAGIAAR